mgnify:CR=1 FL=1
MRHIRVNRRKLLTGAAATGFAASALLPSGGFAQAKTTTVNLQLGWLAGNNQVGEIAAKSQGYFEAEKLNVVIQPGGPSIDGVAIVASGRSLPSSCSTAEGNRFNNSITIASPRLLALRSPSKLNGSKISP